MEVIDHLPCISWAAQSLKYAKRLQIAALCGEPARALRNEKSGDKKEQGGNGGNGEHPAPSRLAVPRSKDLLRRGAAGTGLAMSQFTTWANRIPNTMANWLRETSLPRR